MMWIRKMTIDERTRANTRYAAAIWLGVTQVLLAAVVYYRRFAMGQPNEEIADLRAVLAISIFGYVALQLFLGGVMPVPTWRGAVAAYLGLTTLISGVCLGIYGWPAAGEWTSTWLPAILGPAVLIAAYCLVAWLGQRRIERRIAA